MYIQQAFKGKNDFWRYLVTFFAVIMAQVIGSIPLTIIILLNSNGTDAAMEFRETLNPEVIGLSQNAGLVVLMFPMVLTFFALVLCMRYIHGFSLTNIFTSSKKFRWKNFFFAFIVWALFLSIAEIINYAFNPGNYVCNFKPESFYPLLLISLIMIPLQGGAEELFFRGNLFQGIGILSHSRIVSLLLTSIAFGLLHFSNPEVKQFGFASSMSYYIGFGLFMGILVLFDGGLEMPLAIHAINNIFGAVFVSFSGSVLQTPAMFKINEYNAEAMLIFFIVAAAIFLSISWKVFGWKSYKNIFKPVKDDTVSL